MARVAYWLTGFNPAYPPDYFSFLMGGPYTQAGIELQFDPARRLNWNDLTLQMDYNITVDSGSGPSSYSDTIFSTNASPIADEQEIGLQSTLIAKFDAFIGGVDVSILVNDYFPGTKKFFVFVGMTIAGLVTFPTTANPVGVSLTVLGEGMLLYALPGWTASGTITITEKAYWPYASTGFSNPIWDINTDDQLIKPTPLGF